MKIREIDLQLFGTTMVNWGVTLEIDIDPGGTETFTEVGEGFTDLDEALNEVVNQYQYLNKEGFGESEVTGMQPTWNLTGVRKINDAAQNFIFSKKYELLDERKTDLKITYTDGTGSIVTILMEDVTMAGIKEFGGASTDGSAISVEFHTSQKPVVTVA